MTFDLVFDTIKLMKDKTFITLTGLFFLLFVIGIGAITLDKPLSSILRAKNVAPSQFKSFGMAYPQIASVGNISKGQKPTDVKVSIYIRGIDGSILTNKSVKITVDPSIVNIEPSDTQVTNDIGQAQFTITSQVEGKVKIKAHETTSNIDIMNIPTVEFIK